MEKIIVFADPACKMHKTGDGHPESPLRFDAVMKGVQTLNISNEWIRCPRKALTEELLACHAQSYLELVREEISQLGRDEIAMLSTGDVMISHGTQEAALLAAGAAIEGAERLISGEAGAVFSAMRPPGHHAESRRGMGFCLYNNSALAARTFQKSCPGERVAIIDWDVHHGNGTQEIFYEDPNVFYFSTHRSPFYPYTGKASETGGGTTCNCPYPGGKGTFTYVREIFERVLPERMEVFKPHWIVISAGFDAHEDDPLGGCDLKSEDFQWLTRRVLELAYSLDVKGILSVLEGGYSLKALEESIQSHLRPFLESDR